MPCASVSEKPTRVSDEYLKGGLRVVGRPSSSTNDVEHLVALALHQLFGARLEVQPQQRLRVRRADVEVPILRVDGDSIQVRDASLRAEPLLELRELRLDIGHRRVELARDEVTPAERPQDLAQLLALPGDELEHEQERDHPGIGLREVAEVVMTGDLAAERRALLTHAVLDVRVPDPVDERNAAGAVDGVRHGPAGADVVDDLRPRLLLQD